MNRWKVNVVEFLAFIGWYAIWGWIVGLYVWHWTMPWEVFRWPLTAVLAALSGWPLRRWLTSELKEPTP